MDKKKLNSFFGFSYQHTFLRIRRQRINSYCAYAHENIYGYSSHWDRIKRIHVQTQH